MDGAMSGRIAAGMRRTIRYPEATSCHHVLKSKTSFGRRFSPVFRCSRAVLHSNAGHPAKCVIILGGVGGGLGAEMLVEPYGEE
jgi:hypothetical protein